MVSPMRDGLTTKSRKRLYVGLAIVILLAMSFIWKVAQPGYGDVINFDWSEATAFKYASVKRPPGSLLVKILVTPTDRFFVLQARPHIVRKMHQWHISKASGEIPMGTLGPLPIVLGVAAFGDFKKIVFVPQSQVPSL
jgi:hypothetical protein